MTDGLGVLIVDDDFRVARLHASIVEALRGFHVVAQVGTVTAAREAVADHQVDLALLDVHLPDGSGIDLAAELACDSFIVGAESDSAAVRRATRSGALTYLIKPFDDTELARRLAGYAQYRRLLAAGRVDQRRVDEALSAVRFGNVGRERDAHKSPTESIVLALFDSRDTVLFADDVADRVGIAPPTARRHLAHLVAAGRLRMTLQYGGAGRPKQEYRLP
ncbi:response regulator [Gordonia sp. PDNC005]|jgi:response regulator of citrate/malate metabolism|uniref:response regulator n=1 Tax=unclassified Gordonia (in: high G+C Gram-positive bacteria) TaxID=2657482 RepID=UPI0019648447|nr:response regulator [Gordonia sp. PDNC005]QRY61307.1 response regulator [Gordonia sp. PDNC005]